MKIRFRDKILLFGGAVLSLLSGIFLFVIGVQFFGTLEQALPMWCRVTAIVLSLLMLALGGYLLVFPRNYKRHSDAFVVQRTDEGELRIAVKAIEVLVQKCIDTHDEVKVESMDIRNGREGVTVDLFISLANNISIPLAAASLQKQIKQYLAASSGIDVKEVRISVETTKGGSEPESPDDELQNPLPEEEKPVRTPKEKKVPLHQRIFGKDDQPVTLPEPPKADETTETPEEEEKIEPSSEETFSEEVSEEAVLTEPSATVSVPEEAAEQTEEPLETAETKEESSTHE